VIPPFRRRLKQFFFLVCPPASGHFKAAWRQLWRREPDSPIETVHNHAFRKGDRITIISGSMPGEEFVVTKVESTSTFRVGKIRWYHRILDFFNYIIRRMQEWKNRTQK
jgi:hypothetical protein